jgi:hypothetical protein
MRSKLVGRSCGETGGEDADINGVDTASGNIPAHT